MATPLHTAFRASPEPAHRTTLLRDPFTDARPDALFEQIRSEAADVAAREPLLAPLLRTLVLDSPDMATLLARVLTHRLRQGMPGDVDVLALMQTLWQDAPSAVRQACADLQAVQSRDPACATHLHALINLKGFHALQLHRVNHLLWAQGRPEAAHWLANLSAAAFGVDIHPAARIGCGVMLDHGSGIVIGETSVVEDNVSILQNVTLGGTGKEHGDRHPKVRSGVMIGAGAKVLGNIEIGTMSKVAAGSVVLSDVPPHCTVAGVPARVVRRNEGAHFPAGEMDQAL